VIEFESMAASIHATQKLMAN